MQKLTEATLEEVVVEWFQELGYSYVYGPDIEPEKPGAERKDFTQVVLEGRLRDAVLRLNAGLTQVSADEVVRKVVTPETPSLVQNNRTFHKYLIEGVPVEVTGSDGTKHVSARLVDFDDVDGNDWLVVNQFTIVESHFKRRPDVLVFVNGLPLVVIELKNPADEKVTFETAYNQLQTYKAQIPALFIYNEMMIVSDGHEARVGTLTAPLERFMAWKTIDGDSPAPAGLLELDVLTKGVFDKQRFLELVKHFVVFEDQGGGVVFKKMAGYHQFHAVQHAISETIRARSIAKKWEVNEPVGGYFAGDNRSGLPGDRRIGVVWHTQGSGKSLTMAFYAGCVIVHPEMENPTVVVLTDRNDLDDQLFGVFSRCHELLRQSPTHAATRGELRELLKVASGGVIFTTIQKFMPFEDEDKHPVLSDRGNIVVIADEAHRSQYGFIKGFARNVHEALPNASFIGFTGTPIERDDADTRAVFGDYISIYDIQQAVADKATVPIYYESRLARLELDEAEKPKIDPEFEELTEGEEIDQKEQLKRKWAALEAIVGAEKRIDLIAKDIVEHYERRTEALAGKAMIVCMSRRICVEMYDAIVKLRPEWHDDDDKKGQLKIVMTGSASDPQPWQQHIRSKQRREELANRFKDAKDPFRVVIVRDMWLTGFDAPCLHTMYIDKPMRGHGLMQAIARVNRVFHDKPGGLVVDYIGIADNLRHALSTYTESGGTGTTAIDRSEAVAVMQEKYEICCGIIHGFKWSKAATTKDVLKLSPAAQEHILQQEDGKNRWVKSVKELSRAFALAVPSDEAIAIRDDLMFFQYVAAALAKKIGDSRKSTIDIDSAVRQIISRAVSSDEVVDIFAAAGLRKPDISILSDEFLDEIKAMPHRNLAVEMLQKLLKGEIKTIQKKNVVQARSFTEMLEKAVRAYQNRSIETAQVIEELIQLAKDMRERQQRGEALGLTDDEIAFYDALETSDSAVAILGDDILKQIARDLVATVKGNLKIDWTERDSVRAQLRVMIKRILNKYGYPPNKREKAVTTVIEQAEQLTEFWLS